MNRHAAAPAMVSARTEDAFYLKMQEGQQNWLRFCHIECPDPASQIAFLGRVRDSAILHVGTHGQISVELFDPRLHNKPEINPQIQLGLDGTIGCRKDAPARFQRFDLPKGVKTFRVYEGAVAPGVCFSDEKISFKTMMSVLKRAPGERSRALVAGMDIDPKSYDKDPDYEIDFSHKEWPKHYKHHWKERVYQPQPTQVAAAPGMRRRYPINKRLITTVTELKTANIRLLEWHIVAFMIHDGVFFVIDLNPYLFTYEITRARLRSRSKGSLDLEEGDLDKSDVDYRDDIHSYLYAVTNTSKLVDLFHRTKDITYIDSTCSVLRLNVRDGVNGNFSNGSDDGVVDSFQLRRNKLKLKNLLSSYNPSDHRREIDTLARGILRWYRGKGVLIPQKIIDTGIPNLSIKYIGDMFTTISYDSIWIKPFLYDSAFDQLMLEISEYMNEVSTNPQETQHLMYWINQYLRTNFRKLTLLEKAEAVMQEPEKTGPINQPPEPTVPDPGTPHAALPHRRGDHSRHTSSFEEVLEGDTSIDPSTRKSLLDTHSNSRPPGARSGSRSPLPTGGRGNPHKTRQGKRNKSRNFRNKSRVRRTRRRVIKRKNNKNNLTNNN
jgi:hypothetical protein